MPEGKNMKILTSALVASGNSELADMTSVELGTIAFPSGSMAILEPMTYYTHLDAEIAARRIEVPGPALVTAIVAPVGNLEHRPFGIVLTFSDAAAVTEWTAGEISVDVARIMFADADLIARSWARSEEDHKASQTLGLDEALARNMLTFQPLYAAEKTIGSNEMLLTDGILTSLTGWGDGIYRVVCHGDADGGLVRVIVLFVCDQCDRPIDFLDFGMGPVEPMPLAA